MENGCGLVSIKVSDFPLLKNSVWTMLGGVSFQGWLLAWIRLRELKVGVCIPTSSRDVCTNVGGEWLWLLILVCLDKSPFPIRFPSLVSVYEKMARNGLCVLGCVVRTYS